MTKMMNFSQRILLVAILGAFLLKAEESEQITPPPNLPFPTNFTSMKYNETVAGKTLVKHGISIFSIRLSTDAIVRLTLSSSRSSMKMRLYATVYPRISLLSYHLPVISKFNHQSKPYQYNELSHIICPKWTQLQSEEKNGNRNLTILISAHLEIPFNITLQKITDFDIEPNKIMQTEAAPSHPSVLGLQLPTFADSIVLQIKSTNSHCAIVSIQNEMCPLYDNIIDVKKSLVYQTMSTQAPITIRRSNHNRFYVVLLVLDDDTLCDPNAVAAIDSEPVNGLNRRKTFELTIIKQMSVENYWLGIGFPLSIYLLVIICIIVKIVYQRRQFYSQTQDTTDLIGQKGDILDLIGQQGDASDLIGQQAASDLIGQQAVSDLIGQQGDASDLIGQQAVSDLIGQQGDALVRIGQQADVSDLLSQQANDSTNDKLPIVQHKEYHNEYAWTLFLVFVFFIPPILQLMYTYVKIDQEGHQDFCYYNSLCAHPLWKFPSFNHVFSSSAYSVNGLVFLVLVSHHKRCTMNTAAKSYNILKGIGLSQVILGVTSAIYHICPNAHIYPFDTMYMLATVTLGIVEIYSQINPTKAMKAHTIFAQLALIVLLSMIGKYFNNFWFWSIFTLEYVVIVSLIVQRQCAQSIMTSASKAIADSYCNIRDRFGGDHQLINIEMNIKANNLKDEQNNAESMQVTKTLTGLQVDEVAKSNILKILPILIPKTIFLFTNTAMLLYALIEKPVDVLSYTIFIMFVNFNMYFSFHLANKRFKLPKLMFLFFGLSVLVSVFAGYFYTLPVYDLKLTPAQSRALNRDCILLNFYDSHDCWHFISSIAFLLYSYALLLLNWHQ